MVIQIVKSIPRTLSQQRQIISALKHFSVAVHTLYEILRLTVARLVVGPFWRTCHGNDSQGVFFPI